MIALDREQNIVKTGFRMVAFFTFHSSLTPLLQSKDEMLEYIRHPLKMSYGTILRSVVNRIDGSLVLIDDNLVLKYMRIVSVMKITRNLLILLIIQNKAYIT